MNKLAAMAKSARAVRMRANMEAYEESRGSLGMASQIPQFVSVHDHPPADHGPTASKVRDSSIMRNLRGRIYGESNKPEESKTESETPTFVIGLVIE